MTSSNAKNTTKISCKSEKDENLSKRISTKSLPMDIQHTIHNHLRQNELSKNWSRDSTSMDIKFFEIDEKNLQEDSHINNIPTVSSAVNIISLPSSKKCTTLINSKINQDETLHVDR